MDFTYEPLRLDSGALKMEYYLVPWDSEIIGRPVAQIENIRVFDTERAAAEFEAFNRWREAQRIELCSCRIEHDLVDESIFLQEQGFRFIELNYRPELDNFQQFKVAQDSIQISLASPSDEEVLAKIAAEIFSHGRFHKDPRLGAAIGNFRYETWLRNSFKRPSQTVLKCEMEGSIVGFFVVEYGEGGDCFWSLIGLAPGLGGKGLGTRVWNAMIGYHQRQGIEKISTSISSHNMPVFNLYVKLGFKFPLPQAIFHWMR